ncbi:MAG: zinc ribbon domain-containing protein, partial [Planctomycetota bacterium]
MPNSPCPHCGAELAGGAMCCQGCGRRAVDYRTCPACREPVANEATYCPFCTQKVPTERQLAARALELEVRATRCGAFFTGGLTGLFLPPIITVRGGLITVTKWTILGLRRHQQEINVDRVASVRYTKGIIWGALLIETFGGASEDLTQRGLRQADAREMADQLKAV